MPLAAGFRDAIGDRVAFLRAFVANPRAVGAILPTSRRAVRDMLDLADLSAARRVVELGAGTGVYTEEIVARLAPEATLVALETDADLVALLAQRLEDPRVRVVCDSAENLETYLEGSRADVIVSGLPFTSLGADLRTRILDRVEQALAADGVFLVLQYSPLIQSELHRRFGAVRRRVSLLNVPPAFLFACIRPRSGRATSSTAAEAGA